HRGARQRAWTDRAPGRPRPRPRRDARARRAVRRRARRRRRRGWRLRGVRAPAPRPRRAVSIRVLIADDQQLVRAGFALILKPHTDLDVIGEAADGAEAVALAA